MAELKCKDGTVIQISDETEQELRKAFSPELPRYEDAALGVWVNAKLGWPIQIAAIERGKDGCSRDVEDTERFIKALQECVNYCNRHNLGQN